MPTDVDICNRALLRIGSKQLIGSLLENTTPARVCNAVYTQVRDEVLQAFAWPFCKKSVTLAALTYTRPGWAYAYAMPVDCLKPLRLDNGGRPGASTLSTTSSGMQVGNTWMLNAAPILPEIPFGMEMSDDGASRILLTDESPATLVYTAYSATSTLWPPNFVNALSWKLASELALAIPVKADMHKLFDAQYRAAVAEAAAEAMRAQREDPEPDSYIITSRCL